MVPWVARGVRETWTEPANFLVPAVKPVRADPDHPPWKSIKTL